MKEKWKLFATIIMVMHLVSCSSPGANSTKSLLSEDGKTIAYGIYPQSNVDDQNLVSELNSLANPETNGWYLHKGEYYAKWTVDQLHPVFPVNWFNNGAPIVGGVTYWFKCEPIKWDVISNDNGKCFVMSRVLLDWHRYNESYSEMRDGRYANNYEFSEIRAWLNGDFYASAFALGNDLIQTTTVDNSGIMLYNSPNRNAYACADTEDKVFLLSTQEYWNEDYYGNNNPYNSYAGNGKRMCKTTDWTRARGGWSHYASYWTRTPAARSNYTNEMEVVGEDGSIVSGSGVGGRCGVRPGLTIKIA